MTDELSLHFNGQMILETFLTEKPPVACSTILRSFVQGDVGYGEQTLSHLSEFSYEVSHALHMYRLAIATFRYVITL